MVFLMAAPLYPSPLILDAALVKEKMGSHLEYFDDLSGVDTIQNISSAAFGSRFKPVPKEDYSFGYSSMALWLRFTALNKSGREFAWLLECEYPLLDDICLYTPRGNGYSALCTGDRRPFHTRPLNYPTFVFPLNSPPGESVCYLRIASKGSLNISINAWGQSAFRDSSDEKMRYLWIFYGIMISLITYNFLIFLSSRETSYLHLSLFALSISLQSMVYNGLAFQYLWPDFPPWGNAATYFTSNLSCMCAIQFTRIFLNTKLLMPRYDRLLRTILAGIFVFFILTFFIDYHLSTQIATLIIVPVALILVAGAIYLIINKSRQAVFYMIAWACFVAGVFLVSIRSFGLLQEAFLSHWGYQIGASLIVILLSFGVADKINIMRRELDKTMKALTESEEIYRALIETTGTGYVIVDENGTVIDANEEYVLMAGYHNKNEIINRNPLEWTAVKDREKNARALEQCLQQGYIRNLEVDYAHKEGVIVPLEINATVIEAKGRKNVLTICHDISYRKHFTENLQASLREKEILLKEIHHRVKNNLQIISSLLSLQSNKIADSEILKLYDDMNNRIKAMALIHERLYQSEDLALIDLAEYIKIISHDLKETYALNSGDCTLEFNTVPVMLDIIQAIPCGLMINEILSNIFKYAFPSSFSGRAAITVELRQLNNSEIELKIGDNGVGLPDTVDINRAESLGLSLILLLASQLQGKVEIDKTGGTMFTITFKINEK
jgi:PAS domain S-box-containing protein